MNKRIGSGVLFAAVCASATTALAQDPGRDSTVVQGPFTFDSSIGIEFVRNDNLFRTATDPQEATARVVTPEVALQFEPSKHLFRVGYQGELASYDEFSADDYDDHVVDADAAFRLGRRAELAFSASRRDMHEGRGTGLTEGVEGAFLPDTLDEYTANLTATRFTYGRRDDGASVSVEIGSLDTRYDTNRERTGFFDRETKFSELAFEVPVKGNTRLLVEIDSEDVEYRQIRQGRPSVDSTERHYLIGVQWDASSKTTGSVKVGNLEKEFDATELGSFSSPTWEIAMAWAPRSYSRFELATERTAQESNSLSGDARETTEDSISWIHDWNDRLQMTLSVSQLDEDYKGEGDLRAQQTSRYSLSLAYEIQSWLEWNIAYANFSRSSDVAQFNYDNTGLRTGIRLNF